MLCSCFCFRFGWARTREQKKKMPLSGRNAELGVTRLTRLAKKCKCENTALLNYITVWVLLIATPRQCCPRRRSLTFSRITHSYCKLAFTASSVHVRRRDRGCCILSCMDKSLPLHLALWAFRVDSSYFICHVKLWWLLLSGRHTVSQCVAFPVSLPAVTYSRQQEGSSASALG